MLMLKRNSISDTWSELYSPELHLTKKNLVFGKSRMPRILHGQWVPGIEKTECNASDSRRQEKVPFRVGNHIAWQCNDVMF